MVMATSETFLGLSSTAWTGVNAISASLVLISGVAAAWFARGQLMQAAAARREAEDAAREASRPYVVASFEPSLAGLPLMDFVVRNIGARPAINLTLTSAPPLDSAIQDEGYRLADAKLFTEPIGMLAPAQEMRVFFDNPQDRSDRDDLPDAYRLTATYRDSGGRDYTDVIPLDAAAYKGTTYIQHYGMHDLARAAREIEKRLRRASLLDRGEVEVAVATESRSDRDERRRAQAAETRARVEAFQARAHSRAEEASNEPARKGDEH